MTLSDQVCRSRYYWTSNNSKMAQNRAILTLAEISRIWSIERRHNQRPWMNLTPDFKVTPLFEAEYLGNGTRYRNSFNGILIGLTHTLVNSVIPNDLEWSWVILAKYSMKRSVARFLCDNWAFCCVMSANVEATVFSDVWLLLETGVLPDVSRWIRRKPN